MARAPRLLNLLAFGLHAGLLFGCDGGKDGDEGTDTGANPDMVGEVQFDDADGDTIIDIHDGDWDADGDGDPNYLDEDSDGEVSVGTGLTCGALGALLSQYTSLKHLDLSGNALHNAEVRACQLI